MSALRTRTALASLLCGALAACGTEPTVTSPAPAHSESPATAPDATTAARMVVFDVDGLT